MALLAGAKSEELDLQAKILALALNRVMVAMLSGRRAVWPEIAEAAEELLEGMGTDEGSAPAVASARRLLALLGADLPIT